MDTNKSQSNALVRLNRYSLDINEFYDNLDCDKEQFIRQLQKDMKKQDLQEAAHLSSSTVAKLTHSENVSTAILLKICSTLHCDVSDIMEIVEDDSKEKVVATSR